MNKHLEQVSRVTKDCVSFTWKIENFSSLRRKTGEFVRSSVIKCSDSKFCLKLYPNGKQQPSHVDVILEKVDFPSLPSGEYEIALKDCFGQKRTALYSRIKVSSESAKPSSNKSDLTAPSAFSTSINDYHSLITPSKSSTDKEAQNVFTSTTTTKSFAFNFATDSVSTPARTTSTSIISFAPVPTATSQSVSAEAIAGRPSNVAASTTTSFFNQPLVASIPSSNESTITSSSGFFSSSSSSKPWFAESKKDTKPQVPKTTTPAFSFGTTTSPSSDTTSRIHSIQSIMAYSASISTQMPSLCFSEKTSLDDTLLPVSLSQPFLETDQGISLRRDLLFEFKEELFPDNVLTVLCEMKVTTVVNVSESAVIDEEICSTNGAELLTNNLRGAFENPRFSDVTLKVGDVEFPAHKIILANRSKVFDSMFESAMKESQENVVNLVEMKPSTAEEMLRYMYTGKIQGMSMDRATDLYVVADRYDFPELKQWSKNFMLRHISPDSVCNVSVLANLHGDVDLEKASKRTIRNNLKTVLNSEKWSAFSKENPTLYLEMLKVALLDDSL